MSKDLPEGLAFKEELNLYRYCNGNLNFSTVSHDDEDYSYQKKKMMRDPMSHRIIEKRRRDRMNNCLADLSRLIPPDYLKKGRGRIEKTEIIEMAIKHMRHLQSIISTSRLNEAPSDHMVRSPPEPSANRDGEIPTSPTHQPIIMEHYRLGYLECLSEAMHFLVEVQGYFAGDSLCVQMINHLHRHCDKILKSNSLNYPQKHTIETTSSNSSTSPTNANYSNNSPPLGTSFSNGSNSDDNQPSMPYANDAGFEAIEIPGRTIHDDFRPLRRYSDLSTRDTKKNCESCYPRYSEPENERMSENPSDSDVELSQVANARMRGLRTKNVYEDHSKCSNMSCTPENYSSSSGIGSNGECPLVYDELLVKEENGPSHLRDMLTAPKVITLNYSNASNANGKRSASPVCQPFDSSARPSNDQRQMVPVNQPRLQPDSINYKTHNATGDSIEEVQHEIRQATSETSSLDSSNTDSHSNMYKFKNNIKQRFSKERRNNEEEEDPLRKRPKPNEVDLIQDGYHHCDGEGKLQVPPLKEKIQILNRGEDCDRRSSRYMSDSDMQVESEVETLSNRLSFGHKMKPRPKKWNEGQRLSRVKMSPPFFSPDIPVDYKTTEPKSKPIGLLTITEYLSSDQGLVQKLNGSEPERSVGVPIFALHANGSFYVPLTLDHNVLAQFLPALGLTKSEELDEKTALHPVTISVNFRASYLPKNLNPSPWKYQS